MMNLNMLPFGSQNPGGSGAVQDASVSAALGKVGSAAGGINDQALSASRTAMESLMPGYGDNLKAMGQDLNSYLNGQLASGDVSQIRQQTAERNMLQGRSGGAGQTYGFKLQGDEIARRREFGMQVGNSLLSQGLQNSMHQSQNLMSLLEGQLSLDYQNEMWAKNKSEADAARNQMLGIAGQGMGRAGGNGGGGRGGSSGDHADKPVNSNPYAFGQNSGNTGSGFGNTQFGTKAEQDAINAWMRQPGQQQSVLNSSLNRSLDQINGMQRRIDGGIMFGGKNTDAQDGYNFSNPGINSQEMFPDNGSTLSTDDALNLMNAGLVGD